MQIFDIISSNITKNHYKEHNNSNYSCFLIRDISGKQYQKGIGNQNYHGRWGI